jgi:two-component system, OmpR family, response regulator
MPGPKILLVDDNSELLSLLAQMLTDAGYMPIPFARGRPAIEKLRTERPVLAVLDVLLPDVMGYEVAAVCRKELKIPVIFITGVFKGGRNALDAKVKYDALGYFEKPFEAGLLLDAIQKVVPTGRVMPQPEPAPDEGMDIEIDLDDTDDVDPMELTGRISLKDQGGLSATLQGVKLTAAAPSPTSRPPTSPPRRTTTAAALRPAGGTSGELRDNFPSLITAFYQAQKTGELTLTRGKVKKVIYFEKGQPVFALSNVASDRFGQFLVRVGKIKEEQLQQVFERGKQGSPRRTGDVLLEMGLLKETEKLYYVGQQVKSIIYSVFGWEEGNYQVSFRDRAVEQAIKLDLAPATLIVRGVKKLYKPERLKRLLSPGDRLAPTKDPPYQLSEIALEPWEAQLLAAIDGSQTVAGLIQEVRRPESVVCATIVALLSLHLIDKAT